MSVGKRIKKRRKELGLSVDQVADKLGKNRATVYRYESDEIENLPITVIEPLAKILNVSPSYLMGWDKINEDYDFSTNLVNTYYRGLMKWSEDKLFKNHEKAVVRGHMAELFLRYKSTIENLAYTQRNWDSVKETFEKFYKQKSEPLSDREIKELYLRQELEESIESLASWVKNLPSWVSREEEKYLDSSNKTQEDNLYLLPNAAHEIEGASEEDKAHDDAIMDDENF